jgi:hypothetical protein
MKRTGTHSCAIFAEGDAFEENGDVGEADLKDIRAVEVLSDGGMLVVLGVLAPAGAAPTLVGYARHRGWADR